MRNVKTVSWTIGKKAPSFSINVTTMGLTFGGSNGTITITYDGDGALGATSSSESIAKPTLNNKTITVEPKGAGSATITVTAGEELWNF